MEQNFTCGKRRVNNTMMCGKCGMQWDHKDPEPPACNPTPPPKAPIIKPPKAPSDEKRMSKEELVAGFAELRKMLTEQP